MSEIRPSTIPIVVERPSESTLYAVDTNEIVIGADYRRTAQQLYHEVLGGSLPSLTSNQVSGDYESYFLEKINLLPDDIRSGIYLSSLKPYEHANRVNFTIGILPSALIRLASLGDRQAPGLELLFRDVVEPLKPIVENIDPEIVELAEQISIESISVCSEFAQQEREVGDERLDQKTAKWTDRLKKRLFGRFLGRVDSSAQVAEKIIDSQELGRKNKIHEQVHYVTINNEFDGLLSTLFKLVNQLPYVSESRGVTERSTVILRVGRYFDQARGILEAESITHELLGTLVIDEGQEKYSIPKSERIIRVKTILSELFSQDRDGQNRLKKILEVAPVGNSHRELREHALGMIHILVADLIDYDQYAKTGVFIDSLKTKMGTDDLIKEILRRSGQFLHDEGFAQQLLVQNYELFQTGLTVFADNLRTFLEQNATDLSEAVTKKNPN